MAKNDAGCWTLKCYNALFLTVAKYDSPLKAESLPNYILMTVSILMAGDNRECFDQIGTNWCKIVRYCDDLGLYLSCMTSKDNLDFKS